MMQPFASTHFLDGNGDPDGGTSYAAGIAVGWQAGEIQILEDGRYNPNGATVQTVLAIVWDRLRFFQAHTTACDEYEQALNLIQDAIVALGDRDNRLYPTTPASEMTLEVVGNEDA